MKSSYKRILSLLLTLCMVFSLTTGWGHAAEVDADAAEVAETKETEAEEEEFATLMADGVTYLDFNADGTSNGEQTCTDYTLVTSGSTAWNAGWYVVDSDVTIASRITVTGDVHLILVDGKTLTASAGITVSEGNSLTIYGQSGGTGTLSATGGFDQAGIGGDTSQSGGAITINGGAVTANGGGDGAGIGGGYRGAGGTITINDGTVTANGNTGSAGIGGGLSGAGGTITINGGEVTATGGGYAAGIGGGTNCAGGTIIINAGVVTATGGNNGAGIGSGDNGGADGAITINGGGSGTDVTVTIGAGATVEAGNDAASAMDVTDTFASSHTQKYAKITFAASASVPSYTIKAADTAKDTNKKYQYNDEFTIAVTVSGADYEGGEFVLKYNADVLQLTETPANNILTVNNQTGAESDGTVTFKMMSDALQEETDPLAVLKFKVAAKVTVDTVCEFTFEGTPNVSYDLNKDAVTAETVNGSVTVEPIRYTVTLTGENGAEFVNANGEAITEDTAIDGYAYTAQIGAYDSDNYSYEVTFTSGTGDNKTSKPLTQDNDGKVTVSVDDVKADFTLNVKRTLANFTVQITEDYISGWSLVAVKPDENNHGTPVYTYAGNDMYDMEAYGAYVILVNGVVTEEDARAQVGLGTAALAVIPKDVYDVNATGTVDYSDVLLAYRCYVGTYDTNDLKTYLRAHVTANAQETVKDRKLSVSDASTVDQNRSTASGTQGG